MPPTSYTNTPYYMARNWQTLARFVDLNQRAVTGTSNSGYAVRAWVDGDSQEAPGGSSASHFISSLNYAMRNRYGNSPETDLNQVTGQGGVDPDTTGHWCMATWSNAGNASGRALTYTAYNTEGNLPRIPQFSMGVGQIYCAMGLHHDASGVAQPAGTIPRAGAEYITRAGASWEFYIPRLPGNDTQIHIAHSEDPNPNNPYFGTNLLEETLTIPKIVGAEGPTYAIHSVPIPWATTPAVGNRNTLYGHVRIGAVNAGKTVEISGIVCRSANKVGMTFSLQGRSGVSTPQMQTDRPYCYEMINAYAPDIICKATGANDGNNGYTKATFKQYRQDWIDWVKRNVRTRDGNAPLIILVTDPDRDLSAANPDPATARARFETYAIADYELAQENEGVISLNTWRYLSETYNWRYNDPGFATLCGDGVHCTALGATRLAEAWDVLLQRIARLPLARIRANGRTLEVNFAQAMNVVLGDSPILTLNNRTFGGTLSGFTPTTSKQSVSEITGDMIHPSDQPVVNLDAGIFEDAGSADPSPAYTELPVRNNVLSRG